jgi:hypothetical protein
VVVVNGRSDKCLLPSLFLDKGSRGLLGCPFGCGVWIGWVTHDLSVINSAPAASHAATFCDNNQESKAPLSRDLFDAEPQQTDDGRRGRGHHANNASTMHKQARVRT